VATIARRVAASREEKFMAWQDSIGGKGKEQPRFPAGPHIMPDQNSARIWR
jgi:antibiotic biosynthesis monooxygenase (ABM) superfamily enzyme